MLHVLDMMILLPPMAVEEGYVIDGVCVSVSRITAAASTLVQNDH